MKYVIDNFSYKRDKETDCRITSLQTALKIENIDLRATDTLLFASAITFRFFNAATKQKLPVMSLIGIRPDYIERFAENSGINIKCYKGQNFDEDATIIEEAIVNNHCVIAKADRYQLKCFLQPKLVDKITDKKHMTQHYFMIYGFDTDKNQYLICEPNSAISKFHHMWVDKDEINKARKCQWLDFDIDNDIYIIEDVSGYKLINYTERLYVQLEELCKSINESIPLLKDFLEQFNNCKEDALKRYYIVLTKFLAMTMSGLDLSGYFYRRYIDTALKVTISDRKLLDMSKKNMENWHVLAKHSRKIIGIEDSYQIWHRVLQLAEAELQIWQNAINLL